MVGLGTLINMAAIAAGGTAGLVFRRYLSKSLQTNLMSVMGLVCMFLGTAGTLSLMLRVSGTGPALTSTGSMMMVISFTVGTLIGTILKLEDRFEGFGLWLQRKAGRTGDNGFIGAFVTASLTVCIGAMAVIGSIQDGIAGDYTVLAARNYSDSDKRLFLTNAHLCDSLGQLALASGMTNAQAAQKLMELIGFSDTNQVIMCDDSYAQAFLTGSWSSDAGELTVADDGTVTCSLPGLSGKECTLRDGAIYAGTGEDAVAFYRFSVLSDRMMIADAVGDGRAYTMFRQ